MNELEKKAYAYATKRLQDPNFPVYNWETEITDAYAQGYKDAVEKACEWLKDNVEIYFDIDGNKPIIDVADLLKDFERDMEEQQ